MPPRKPLRYQAFGAVLMLALLVVVTGAAPARSNDRLPDRIIADPPALSDFNIAELQVFDGEPLRFELVAYSGEVVAAVFVHNAGRGLYGDFQRARTESAEAYYAALSAEAPRAMLHAIMRDLTASRGAPARRMELSLAR